MSALKFLMKGGMALTDSDLPDHEQELCNEFLVRLGRTVAEQGRLYKSPVSKLSIFQVKYLFIGKDPTHYHFVFVDKGVRNYISYRDISKLGRLSTELLASLIGIELGAVHWATAIPVADISRVSGEEVREMANQYIERILEDNLAEKL